MEIKFIDHIDDFKEFINDLFDEAIWMWVSDIHIEVLKEKVIIRYRIDGDIHQFYNIWYENKDNLITRIKILAQLKIDESRLPQDWQIVYSYENEKSSSEDIDMRISTFPTIHWEKIVVRLLRKDMNLLNLDRLWFTQYNLNSIKKVLWLKEWLILLWWATWSGKTTTLYSMLNSFNPFKYNICTLEDPIEYKIEWINQSQVKSEIWYDFSSWLRTLLRQDPDIILVWEIRDKETAKLAIEASMTWHLVFGTIHANKWIWVVERLLNMWIDPYLIASSLKMILSQRLVKKTCSCAIESSELNPDYERIFKDGIPHIWDSIKSNIKIKTPSWCENCLNSWYKWRLWLYELVVIDDDISRLISAWLDSSKRYELSREKGMMTAYQDGLLKSAYWLTDINQILPYKDL